MGRKIPARKHHGVRDPIKQNEQRLALIKDKINNPPEKQDFQKVSHKLADFIKLKDETKVTPGKVKRLINREDVPENYTNKNQKHRNNKELPNIKRMQNEDDEDYLRRVNRITRESIKESQFEAKYGVEVIRNKKTGEITLKKRPIDELEVEMKKALKNRNPDGTEKKKREVDVTLTAAERMKVVKEMMKKKKTAKAAEKIVEYQRDDIKFGEVVHAPPTLAVPRRAQKAETVSRPGSKKSLLLHSVIENNTAQQDLVSKKSTPGITKTTTFKPVDLKGKRKELPAATREMIEQQQQNVVNMYREMKKNNRKNNINV